MAKKKTIPEIIKDALDGRTQRWLSHKTGIAEDKLSNKLQGYTEFTVSEINMINQILSLELPLPVTE